jgi:transcription initiation factor TFIIIB Brf1 subunit/transcription initiation factor TFIIB
MTDLIAIAQQIATFVTNAKQQTVNDKQEIADLQAKLAAALAAPPSSQVEIDAAKTAQANAEANLATAQTNLKQVTDQLTEKNTTDEQVASLLQSVLTPPA